MSECKKNGGGPWQSHPKRMLRHKALIQCARLAFGYGGIYDQDEAERIVEVDTSTGEIVKPKAYEKPALEYCSDEYFSQNKEKLYKIISSGKKSAVDVITSIESSKYLFTEAQKEEISYWEDYIEGDAA